MSTAHLAIDLGASSGRAIVGTLAGDTGRLELQEVHRFAHHACPTPAGPVWNLTGIWLNILTGLRKAVRWCKEKKFQLVSVGVDTWGVDWVLVGGSGELLALPHCYRDPQNEAAAEQVLEKLGGFEKLYERTGIQFLAFNTLFQVAARHQAAPRLFDAAERLLLLPDLFHYWLSGELTNERTAASTTSMLNLHSGAWDTALLEGLGLPTHMLGPILEPGTVLGKLRDEVAEQTRAPANLKVIAPGAHDTASAVAAAPATGEASWAFISSGTWSILGAELPEPIYSAAARQGSFSNEGGVGGTVRFLKNIAGLWILQELRRELELAGDDRNFANLVEEARAAEPFRTLIDPNDHEFAAPGDMAGKIRRFAKVTGQPQPETIGQLVRASLESLALCYRQTLDLLESVLHRKFDVVHVVGGGTKNQLLTEFTAAAVSRPLISGPVEATAIGNLMMQAMGSGELPDLTATRQVIARSFELERVEPASTAAWDNARAQFAKLTTD